MNREVHVRSLWGAGGEIPPVYSAETSRQKGQTYITVDVDLEARRVLHVVKGKDANTIKEIKNYLENKGVRPEQIKQTSIDLSPAFISGIIKHFPVANITFDRFHVVTLLNEAMDDVRKQERKEHEQLKGHKYTFLKNNFNSMNSLPCIQH